MNHLRRLSFLRMHNYPREQKCKFQNYKAILTSPRFFQNYSKNYMIWVTTFRTLLRELQLGHSAKEGLSVPPLHSLLICMHSFDKQRVGNCDPISLFHLKQPMFFTAKLKDTKQSSNWKLARNASAAVPHNVSSPANTSWIGRWN